MQGPSFIVQMKKIDDFVFQQFKEKRQRREPIHDYHLKKWGMQQKVEVLYLFSVNLNLNR